MTEAELPRRPWQVQIAVTLLLIEVACVLYMATGYLVHLLAVSDVIPRAAAATHASMEEVAGYEKSQPFAMGVPAAGILWAILLSVCAIGVWRMRIWGMASIIVLSLFTVTCGGIVSLLSFRNQQPIDGGTAFEQELFRLADAAQPAWLIPHPRPLLLVVALSFPIGVLLLLPMSQLIAKRV